MLHSKNLPFTTIQLRALSDSSLRDSITPLSRSLLSRNQFFEQQHEQQNGTTQPVLIAHSPHEFKISILYTIGGLIVIFSAMTLHHIFSDNTIMLGTSVQEVPEISSIFQSLDELKEKVEEEKRKHPDAPIVPFKSLPDNQKIPFTVFLVGLTGIYFSLVMLVKNRMAIRLYVNNPNNYIRYKKQSYVQSSGSVPASLVQQNQKLLDELTFSMDTNASLLPGSRVQFSKQEVAHVEQDGSIVYLKIGDENKSKRYFFYADNKETARELVDFMKK